MCYRLTHKEEVCLSAFGCVWLRLGVFAVFWGSWEHFECVLRCFGCILSVFGYVWVCLMCLDVFLGVLSVFGVFWGSWEHFGCVLDVF